MRRAARRLARQVAMLGWAMAVGAAGAAAQPRGTPVQPYQAVLDGAEPSTGLGVTLPVRILDARDQTPAVDVRISGARLVSPFGVVTPLPQTPSAGAAPGMRVFQGDLPTPGPWTLEFTVSGGGRPATATMVAFTAAPSAQRPSVADPMGASVVAADPSAAAAGPAVAPPGPGAPGSTPPAPAPASRSAGYSPATPPFCAECAAEAPH